MVGQFTRLCLTGTRQDRSFQGHGIAKSHSLVIEVNDSLDFQWIADCLQVFSSHLIYCQIFNLEFVFWHFDKIRSLDCIGHTVILCFFNLFVLVSGFPRILESPWEYLNFFILNSRPWKYLKTGQVLESPWISLVRSLNSPSQTVRYQHLR